MKYIGRRKCYCDIKDDPYLGSGTIFEAAVKKYGRHNFEKEILAVCATEEECCKLEEEIIRSLCAVRSREYYNIAPGGKSRPDGFIMTK